MLEALSEAHKQYDRYVELAEIVRLSSQPKLEELSYRHGWDYPLGLAIVE